MNQTRPPESLWSVLAAVRFFLALVVFASHLAWFVPLPPALYVLSTFGGIPAVFGFLLISGFSVGHSHRERPEGYYARRFLRIYPLYFAAVLLAQILVWTLGPDLVLPGRDFHSSGWKTTVANFFLLQEFITIAHSYNQPLWSLAVEVFFYLWVPLLARLRPLGILALVLLSAGLFVTALDRPMYLWGYKAALYAWPWLIGFLYGSHGKRVLAFALAVSGWFLVQGFPAGEEDFLRGWTWALVVLAVFAGGWIRLPILLRRWLDYLGELSYPLYLLHAPLGLALYFFAGIRGVGAMVILVLAGVALLNHLVDHGLKKVFWIPLVRKAVAWTQGRT